MPTSNGQVGSRDIRQSAIKQSHVFPAAIGTTELEDLSATISKVASPSFVFVGESARFHNVTLTTTNTNLSSLSVDIPTFVGRIFVMAIASAQITNTSGGAVDLIVSATVNGIEALGSADRQQGQVVDNSTGSLSHVFTTAMSAPGSTVTAEVWARVSSGTNTSNNGEINVVVLGER